MSTARCLPALLALLPAAALAAQDSQPQKHLLRYSFAEGDVAHCVLVSSSDAKVSMSGQPMDQASKLHVYMTMEVKGSQNGKALVSSKLTRIKMDVENPMMPMKFDTDDEDSVPAMLDSVLDMVGQEITSEVDDRGVRNDVSIPKEFNSPQTAGVGLNPQQMLAQFSVTFPEEAVAVGDTWPATFTRSMGQLGSMTMNVTNKLESIEGDTLTITQDIDMTVEGAGPLKMTGEVTEASGTVVLKLSEVLPQEAAMNMDMDLAVDHPSVKMEMAMKSQSSMQRTPPPASESKGKDDGDN